MSDRNWEYVAGSETGDARFANVEQLVRLEDRLKDRLLSLERRNGVLRGRVAILIFLVLAQTAAVGTLAYMARQTPDLASAEVVQARRFVLVGRNGVERGSLGLDDDGSVRLALNDDLGVARARVGVLPGGSPGVSFADKNGERRLVLGLLDDAASLVFASADGIPRIVFGVSEEESANLVFADAGGITRVGFGVGVDGAETVLLPEAGDPLTQDGEPGPSDTGGGF